MVDSIYKYELIIERFEAGDKEPFVDAQFPANGDSIGPKIYSDYPEIEWM